MFQKTIVKLNLVIGKWYQGYGLWIESLEGKPLIYREDIGKLRKVIKKKFGKTEDKVYL